MLIDFAGIPYDQAMKIVGRQGKFEMRIQTDGNNSTHVLYGDEVQGVGDPTSTIQNDGTTSWGVTFGLTSAGAQTFQQACIANGATKDPNNHYVMMLLDDKVFYSRPLSSDLATSLATKPVDTMVAMTGYGRRWPDNG